MSPRHTQQSLRHSTTEHANVRTSLSEFYDAYQAHGMSPIAGTAVFPTLPEREESVEGFSESNNIVAMKTVIPTGTNTTVTNANAATKSGTATASTGNSTTSHPILSAMDLVKQEYKKRPMNEQELMLKQN